jgi:hypothetical protein
METEMTEASQIKTLISDLLDEVEDTDLLDLIYKLLLESLRG